MILCDTPKPVCGNIFGVILADQIIS